MPNYVADEKTLDYGLTPQEKFEKRLPHTGAIFAAEEHGRQARFESYLAFQRQRSAAQDEIGRRATALERHYKSGIDDPPTLERLEADLKAAKAVIPNLVEQQDHAQKSATPSMAEMLEEWLSKAVNTAGNFEIANETDEAPPGKNEPQMVAHYAAIRMGLLKDLEANIKAPIHDDELEFKIRDDVHSYSRSLDDALASARRMNYSDIRGVFSSRRMQLPQLTLGDGVRILDVGGVLMELFGDEISERLIKRAREKFGTGGGISLDARNKRHAEISAAIDRAERLGEFWVRRCRAVGLNAPARNCGTNAEAVLSIKRRR